jgi:hypothetical protein
LHKTDKFEALDFIFGERWIPSGIYSNYAEHLFDVTTNVNYASNSDEYSVKADYRQNSLSRQGGHYTKKTRENLQRDKKQ